MFAIEHPALEYKHPYRWRTWSRLALPRPICRWIGKGENCESVSAEHHWYNAGDEHSACYHCELISKGKLWEI